MDQAALLNGLALDPFAVEQDGLPAAGVDCPVTVEEWKACNAQSGCGPLPRMMVAEDTTPVHNVSWDDAQ